MTLSIILTVYNKEKYIEKALDSLVKQENHSSKYEILVVNDGSTDRSLAIIEQYIRKYSNIRLLAQENMGLSMARNNGMEAAKGEYIWFVDADDIISPNSVKLISAAAESSPDIIPIYARTDGSDDIRNVINPNLKTGKDILLSLKWEQCGVFNIFKKSFLIENGLFFLPGVFHEDAEFTPRALYYAKTAKVIPEVLYTVFRDPCSITQVPRSKRAFDYLVVSENLSKFVLKKGEDMTIIGKAIDEYTAININNAFNIICKNSRSEQSKFNDFFYTKRTLLIRALSGSISLKYRLEGLLFRLLSRKVVFVYKFLKTFTL